MKMSAIGILFSIQKTNEQKEKTQNIYKDKALRWLILYKMRIKTNKKY